jgi:glycosyltransferase involved in cell wall biosynthesis
VVLAGEAPSPELLSLAETLGLSDSLWHVAGTSNHELEALYNLAHALVFPSLSEGFGWPVAEAQACGCPVLSSNTTSLPEVAGPNEGLLFEPTDHQGMALAVQRLQNSSFRQTVIRSGLEHVRRFSLSNMIDLYASRYERMLAPTHR